MPVDGGAAAYPREDVVNNNASGGLCHSWLKLSIHIFYLLVQIPQDVAFRMYSDWFSLLNCVSVHALVLSVPMHAPVSRRRQKADSKQLWFLNIGRSRGPWEMWGLQNDFGIPLKASMSNPDLEGLHESKIS